jgi:hypothetical protein
MANGLAPHNLCVLRVPYGTLDLDSSRLVHPVALDDPYQNSACHVPLAPVTTLQFVSVFSLLSTVIEMRPSLILTTEAYPRAFAKGSPPATQNRHRDLNHQQTSSAVFGSF